MTIIKLFVVKLIHCESFITHMLLVCEKVSFLFFVFCFFVFGTNWRELIDTGDCEIFTRGKLGACPKIRWCVSCQAPSLETKSFHSSTKQGEHLVLFVWTLLGYLEGMLHFKISLEFGCPMICDPKVKTSIRFLKWALNANFLAIRSYREVHHLVTDSKSRRWSFKNLESKLRCKLHEKG
jgi:hypothetical protein